MPNENIIPIRRHFGDCKTVFDQDVARAFVGSSCHMRCSKNARRRQALGAGDTFS
jgi:hypothetical protein